MTRSAVRVIPVALLLLVGPVRPCPAAWQIEYTDVMVEAMRRVGNPVPKRLGSYPTRAKCQEAIRQAVAQSGDPGLANHMYPVGFDDPVPAPRPVAPSSSLDGPAPRPRNVDFARERDGLVSRMKGSGRLAIKTRPSVILRRTQPTAAATPPVSPVPAGPTDAQRRALESAAQALEAELDALSRDLQRATP